MSASTFLGPELTEEAGVESSGTTADLIDAQHLITRVELADAGPFETSLSRLLAESNAEAVGIPSGDVDIIRDDPLNLHQARADPGSLIPEGLPGIGTILGGVGILISLITILIVVYVLGQLFEVTV